jgi:hypothetical protein
VARFLATIYEHIGPSSLPVYLWLYRSLLGLGRFFSFLILHTVGGTLWTGDQPVVRPLPTNRTTQTQTKRTHIHALSGIRTHDPNFRASEDCPCTGLRSHYDRHQLTNLWFILSLFISRYPRCSLTWILLYSLALQLFAPGPNPAGRNLPNYLRVVTEWKSFAIVIGLIKYVHYILM